MEVNSYVFQSPHPKQVQLGRPDASSQKSEEKQVRNSEQFKKSTQLELEAKAHEASVERSSAADSINVANSTANSSVATSLDSFSTANSQAKALSAYSNS